MPNSTTTAPHLNPKDIRDKIDAKGYQPKAEILTKPKEPSILRLTASQLTNEQLASIPALREEHEKGLAASRESLAVWRKENGECEGKFEEDCAAAFGLTNSLVRSIVWSKAWEHGHSSGYHSILDWYDDYSEFAGNVLQAVNKPPQIVP